MRAQRIGPRAGRRGGFDVATAAAPVALLLVLATGYGAALSAGEPRVAPPPAPAGFALRGDVDRGRALFTKSCSTCHGETGDGKGRIVLNPPAGDLRDPERIGRRSDWQPEPMRKGP